MKSRTDGKSEIEFFSDLLEGLMKDMGNLVPHLDFTHEILVVKRRAAMEGLGFFLYSLPCFGKTVLNALRIGRFISPPRFPFKRKRGTVIPLFLSDLTMKLFTSNGYERDDAEPIYLEFILQLCFVAKKYPPVNKGEEEKMHSTAIQKSLANEDTVRDCLDDPSKWAGVCQRYRNDRYGDEGETREIIAHAQNLLSMVLEDFDTSEIRPGHGPGSVAEGGLQLAEKYEHVLNSDFDVDLERIFERQEYTYPTPILGRNVGLVLARDNPGVRVPAPAPDSLSKPEINLKRLSRATTVPKDAEKRRGISLEPALLMYFQQGVWKRLKVVIEVLCPLTAGHVNFTDQAVNGDLAQESSVTGFLATLDLKDASDLVSYKLVREIFPPSFIDILDAVRSTHTEFATANSYTIRELAKFAPMGSAVCFPVEALVFWALCVAGVKTSYPELSYQDIIPHVYVYGDDMLVPTAWSSIVCKTLTHFGLTINLEKSYTSRACRFRESCGVDAYKGEQVTPIKLSQGLPQDSKTDVASLVSYVEVSNSFHKKGYFHAAKVIQTYIEEDLLKMRLPVVPWSSGLLGWHSFSGPIDPTDQWRPSEHLEVGMFLVAEGDGFQVFDRYIPEKPSYGVGMKRRVMRAVKKKTYLDEEAYPEQTRYLHWLLQAPQGERAYNEERDFASRRLSSRDTDLYIRWETFLFT